MCEHNKSRNLCRVCYISAFCTHDRQKATCKDCGGSSFASTTRDATAVEFRGAGTCALRRQSASRHRAGVSDAAAQRLAVELIEGGSIRVNTEPPDAVWVTGCIRVFQNLSLEICRATGRVPHAVKYQGCAGRARRGAAQLISAAPGTRKVSCQASGDMCVAAAAAAEAASSLRLSSQGY